MICGERPPYFFSFFFFWQFPHTCCLASPCSLLCSALSRQVPFRSDTPNCQIAHSPSIEDTFVGQDTPNKQASEQRSPSRKIQNMLPPATSASNPISILFPAPTSSIHLPQNVHRPSILAAKISLAPLTLNPPSQPLPRTTNPISRPRDHEAQSNTQRRKLKDRILAAHSHGLRRDALSLPPESLF